MARNAFGKFAKAEKPDRVELLTVEAHPILGRMERWRLSDGTVETVYLKQVFQE